MLTTYEITLIIYNIALVPIIFLSFIYLTLCFLNITLSKTDNSKIKKLNEYPFVSVQIPSFNDPIAERCVRSCMEFDYPKDKYEIIIVDDSTNVKTQILLSSIAEENPGFIKYIHRDNRHGYKPGALKNAMKITKGEIIVVFDSDWIPDKDFLKTVVKPFSDEKVAIVQTRQGFYNHNKNIITRYAAYSLMIYHTIFMPINNKLNCVFFCGTAGALRRKAFDEVGGWNTNSITEDSELSVKLLIKGYKTVYIDKETPSEVPDTLESFVKQQMRWCYGNTRVFFDNAFKILFKKGLSLKQRIMVSFITLANISTPFVVIMTFFGFIGWFVGEPKILVWGDFFEFISKFIYTSGFFLMGVITLKKHKRLNEVGHFALAGFVMGIVIATGNAYAFLKAVFNSRLNWYCTPKSQNETVIK